jgi:hypothetical protein
MNKVRDHIVNELWIKPDLDIFKTITKDPTPHIRNKASREIQTPLFDVVWSQVWIHVRDQLMEHYQK